jgi:hypothetical protein
MCKLGSIIEMFQDMKFGFLLSISKARGAWMWPATRGVNMKVQLCRYYRNVDDV